MLLALSTALATLACAGPGADEARLAELEGRNAELNRQLSEIRERHPDIIGGIQVDTFVLRREEQWVVLGKGELDGVEVGWTFEVYRGATYKGAVRVSSVEEGTSRADIVREIDPIEAGDSASNAL